jgi:DNA polymerase I-like protein with 3'-5' exonuclease and polymerase domains
MGRMNEHLLPHFVCPDDVEAIYKTGNFVALDFETDNEGKGSPLVESNDIVLACWIVYKDWKPVARRHVWGGIYDMSLLLQDIAEADLLVAMNAKFELGWLKRCGMELRDVLVYDPMLVQWALDGNLKGKGYERSLKALAKRYATPTKLDIIGKLFDLGYGTRDINTSWMLDYCYRDVDVLVAVMQKQMAVVDSRDMWHIVHTRHLTCAVLADIEFEGLHLDAAKVEEEHKRVSDRLESLGAELAEMTGGINLGSPKQLGVYLYDTLGFKEVRDHKGQPIRTGKGARATDSKVLAQLEAETEEQRKFLTLYKEYNKAASLLEKNLEYFLQTCIHNGCTFKGQFKQNAVMTGRLASSGIETRFPGRKGTMSVQLQNIPREYKPLFWSGDDDYMVVSFDSSQVEFRVAVDMARDEVGMEEVRTGTDIHSYTAEVLTANRDPEMLSLPSAKDRRQNAKKSTFRPLYGGGSGSDAIKAYCEFFKKKYAKLSAMQYGWALECADRGSYRTPYGMSFFFPGTKVQRSGYITNTTNIYNFPIQGFATGEIIPLALVYFWHKTRELRTRIFATIHDSIDTKTHKDDVDQVAEIAKECLTLDVYNHLEKVYKYEMITPLGLGITVAKYWGDKEATEYKYDVLRDGTIIER